MASTNNVSVDEIRDELLQAAKAAATEGHPLRWAVFGHFAERVIRLAEDHQRLSAIVEKQATNR